MRSVGIAVHEECGAGRKCDFGGGVVGLGVDAQNEFGGQPQEFGPAVGVAEQGWRVSSGGETGAVMGEVELGDQAAGEQSGVEVGQEAVGAGEQVSGGGACGGVRLDSGADLPHQEDGGVVALDVADRRCGGGGSVDEVVEVAADSHAVAGRLVAGGDVKAGDVGQGGGSRPVWTVWARVCWAS